MTHPPAFPWLTTLASVLVITWVPQPAASQAAGVIQGRVELQDAPVARRSASRYPGGRTQTQQIQTPPAVAYLVGPVAGANVETGAVMTQRDTTFIPSVVFVPPGGSVTFPNEDPFQHNVYSYSGPRTFDLGRQNPRSSSLETFPRSGIVEVFCEVHEFMRGVIIVTENPYSAIVGADGSFRITGVPAGEYVVAFWHSDHELEEQTVTVEAGGTATVEVQMRR